jgi:hypothetical protein
LLEYSKCFDSKPGLSPSNIQQPSSPVSFSIPSSLSLPCPYSLTLILPRRSRPSQQHHRQMPCTLSGHTKRTKAQSTSRRWVALKWFMGNSGVCFMSFPASPDPHNHQLMFLPWRTPIEINIMRISHPTFPASHISHNPATQTVRLTLVREYLGLSRRRFSKSRDANQLRTLRCLECAIELVLDFGF